MPNRINWVLSVLSEAGVPVVLIGRTKLFDTLGRVEARTGWDRSRFVNQMTRGAVELPAGLEQKDVQAVGAAFLQEGESATRTPNSEKIGDRVWRARRDSNAGPSA